MDCPRCGTALETYALGDREERVCDACGFVGVEVTHESEYLVPESWQRAIERFYEE